MADLVRLDDHQDQATWRRFWSKVRVGDGCWEWRASLTRNGYGNFWYGQTMAKAHRVAYELLVGPIPEGMVVDHLCRNRRCQRPDHMEIVTMGENTLRGTSFAAENARKTHCKWGHEFTPENTQLFRYGTGKIGRKCKTCHVRVRRAHYERTKATAA